MIAPVPFKGAFSAHTAAQLSSDASLAWVGLGAMSVPILFIPIYPAMEAQDRLLRVQERKVETVMTLRVLSGGAANGLVSAFARQLSDDTGHAIDGDFGAVGARRDRILNGEPVDLIILTDALIGELVTAGLAEAATVANLGLVATGVAVPLGAAIPDITSPDALRDAILAADGVFTGDPENATAAIHFKSVLEKLGVMDRIADRFHTYPGGQEAMAAMAVSGLSRPIGCTQITEIRNVEGVHYVGDLPDPHGLSTTYTAAVASKAEHPEIAQRLIELMTSASAAEVRHAKGFGT